MSSAKFDTKDYILIAINTMLLIIVWFTITIEYKNLPDTIPTHFNLAGEADRYSSKAYIWLAPSLFTFISLVLIIFAKYQSIFTIYKRKITDLEQHYNIKKALFSSLLMSCILFLITISMITASSKNTTPTKWIIPIIFILIIISVVGLWYYKYKVFKKKK